jgi:hypothetical protein
MKTHAALALALLTSTPVRAQDPAGDTPAPHPLEALRAEAEAVAPLVTHPAVRALLAEVGVLPVPDERTVHVRTRPEKAGYTAEQFEQLPPSERETLQAWTPSPARYYATFYGSPLAYCRALDLAAHAGGDAFSFDKTRVLDLGYGQMGQLRLLAGAGAHAVGVDPDPLLAALYSHEADTGPYTGASGETGSVTLVSGTWPGDDGTVETVGDGYDLFIARNLLKRGYIAPLAETPSWAKVDLGVAPEDFPACLAAVLEPGGLAMIYNLGGTPSGPGSINPDLDYNAAADIAQPWPREAWEKAGFTVIAYDADDTEAAIAQMTALGQIPEGTDPEGEFFARYTLLRRD